MPRFFRPHMSALVSLVAMFGCTDARRCERDADCGADARCDAELRVCVETSARCEPACGSLEECVGPSRCEARYTGVRVVSPAPMARVGARATTVRAALELAAGRQRNDPPTLKAEVTAPSGAVTHLVLELVDVGEYAGMWTAAESGEHQLVAMIDDGSFLSAPVSLLAEFVAPEFVVTWPAPPSRVDGGVTSGYDPAAGFGAAWRRDERVRVEVRSADEDVASESVQLIVWGTDGGSPLAALPARSVGVSTSGCDAAYCGEVEVDLAEPELRAFRGHFTLEVRGEDLAGNPGTGSAQLPVTRWKWRWESEPHAVVATPAIGGDGRIYLGTNSTTGAFTALSPEGAVVWAETIGRMRASPSVHSHQGREVVFAVSNGADSSAIRAFATDGGVLDTCERTGETGAQASPAVMTTSSGDDVDLPTAVAHINGTAGRLLAMRVGAETPCLSVTGAGRVDAPGNIVVAGGAAYLANADTSALRRVSFSDTSGAFDHSPGWPVDAGVILRGLAADEERLFGTTAFGDPGLNEFELSAGTPREAVRVGGSSQPPILTTASAIWGDAFGTLFKSTDGNPLQSEPWSEPVTGAPVAGRDGTLYVTREQGSVEARSELLELQWRADLAVELVASPTIDCSRGASGQKLAGRPGVLYVGTAVPGGLLAIIVDSAGIDVTARWPKYQHDPRNTGNTATDLAEFTCD